MKSSLTVAFLICIQATLFSQALSENELSFQKGYEYMLQGNLSEAITIFEKEIFELKNYNAVPYYRLAYCSAAEEDNPSKKKVEKATKLAKKAKNDWGACFLPAHYKRALPLMHEKADNGNAVAQALLALGYQNGLGLKVNKEKAAEYLSLSASQGINCSKYLLGTYYAKGIGVEKDLDKAIVLIEEALESDPHLFNKKYLNKLKSKRKKEGL